MNRRVRIPKQETRKVFWFSFNLVLIAVLSCNAELSLTYLGRATNYANDLVLSGQYVYTVGDVSGVWIYDVTDPAHPITLGHTNNPGGGNSITVAGDYAYVANGTDGMRIYDISNPANPRNVGHTLTNYGGQAWAIEISGNLAFVANQNDGLRVFDVSDPTNPVNIGHTITNHGGAAYALALVDNYAYVANDNDGLRVFDISNVTNIVSIGSTNNGLASSLAISGNYAYVYHRSSAGVVIYDISNPLSPKKVSSVTGSGPLIGPHLTTVRDGYMVQTLGGPLRIYDVSNPVQPALVASTNIQSWFYSGVVFSNNFIFETVEFEGLKIFSVAGPKLKIISTETNAVAISWASPSTGFSLQQNLNFSSPAWVDVTNIPLVVSNRNQVILPPSESAAFFRLKFH